MNSKDESLANNSLANSWRELAISYKKESEDMLETINDLQRKLDMIRGVALSRA